MAAEGYQGGRVNPLSSLDESDPELLKTFQKLGVTRDEQRRLTGIDSATFLAVIFPHNQTQILPYSRVLKDLNGLTAAQLWKLVGFSPLRAKSRWGGDASAQT